MKKRKHQEWSFGLVSFCSAKQLKIGQTVKAFIEYAKLEGEDWNQLVQDNWQKFAAFVNRGLLTGELKGRKVSVSNGSAEYEREKNKQYYATPLEVRQWWASMSNKSKDKYAILQSYFAKNNLSWPPMADKEVNAAKNAPRYYAIVEAGLLDNFNEYLNTLS